MSTQDSRAKPHWRLGPTGCPHTQDVVVCELPQDSPPAATFHSFPSLPYYSSILAASGRPVEGWLLSLGSHPTLRAHDVFSSVRWLADNHINKEPNP